jgi:hypothetical protein
MSSQPLNPTEILRLQAQSLDSIDQQHKSELSQLSQMEVQNQRIITLLETLVAKQSASIPATPVVHLPKQRNYHFWLLFITGLALIIAVLLGIQFAITYHQNQINSQRAAEYQKRVEQASTLVNTQQDVIIGLFKDYQAAAYENVSVDRITEQQLLAAEYTIQALQIIALQNSQIIELLSAIP